MAKVAVNTGLIGQTSYRPDTLFSDQIHERDIIDLRNSSHKVQDYKRLLEREFNKAVSGDVRGEEGEWEIVEEFYHTPTIASANTSCGYLSTYLYDNTTVGYGTKYGFGSKQFITDNVKVFVQSDTRFYEVAVIENSGYLWLSHKHGAVNTDFTVGNTYKVIVAIPSTRKKSNTITHCDIIGNPANYYRGQTYNDSTTQDIAIDDVIWAKAASGGGTAGNFYKALTAQSAIDLATQDYSNATNWTDLGSDWDGAGSWRTGISGTPLVVGENGEDYSYDGTSKYFKFSKKVISNKFRLYSDDYGVTWGYSTDYVSIGYSATTNSIGPFVTTPTHRIHMFFYETHTNMTENAVNSEVIEFGFMQLLTSISYNKLSESLINKVAYTEGTTEWDRKYPLDRTSIRLSDDKLHMNENYKHPILSPWPSTLSRPVKIMPFITKENNKAYINMVFKEIKYEPTSGDDEIFRVVDNVSTTIDDNGNTVLIGQKRIELPYFIEDKE